MSTKKKLTVSKAGKLKKRVSDAPVTKEKDWELPGAKNPEHEQSVEDEREQQSPSSAEGIKAKIQKVSGNLRERAAVRLAVE
jgi:hypothetical protein